MGRKARSKLKARQSKAKTKSNPKVTAQESSETSSEIPEKDGDVELLRKISGVRDGYESLKTLAVMTAPYFTTDEARQELADRLETQLLELVKQEMVFTRTARVFDEEERNVQENDSSDVDSFLKSIDNFGTTSTGRLNEYEASITDKELKAHPNYIATKGYIQKLLSGGAAAVGSGNRGKGRKANPVVAVVDDDDDDDDDMEEGNEDDEEQDNEDEEEQQEENAEQQQSGEEQSDEEQEENEEENQEEEEDEEDVVEEDDGLPIIDPITKEELKEPVKNKKCGHIYGRSTVTQLIKKNPKTRCPIAGCSNKEFIKLTNLAGDRQLTIAIKKKQAEAKQRNK